MGKFKNDTTKTNNMKINQIYKTLHSILHKRINLIIPLNLIILITACNAKEKSIKEKIIGKHQVIEIIIGEETNKINQQTYFNFTSDGFLFVEQNENKKAIGEWQIDSISNNVMLTINEENSSYNVKMNLIDDDSIITLRGYTIGDKKIFYSIKMSNGSLIPNSSISSKNTELINIISYCLQNKTADWRATGKFGIPVNWTTESIESTNEYMSAIGSYQRRGTFVPLINGKNYYDSEWTITLYGNFHYYSTIVLDSYSAPEFESEINIEEYLKKHYKIISIKKELSSEEANPNIPDSYVLVFNVSSDKYGNGEISYSKSCGTICSINLSF